MSDPVLVIKTDDGQTILHGRTDRNYGDRTEQQSFAENFIARRFPEKSLVSFGLGDSDTMGPWMDAGGDMHDIEVDDFGNVTLPALP